MAIMVVTLLDGIVPRDCLQKTVLEPNYSLYCSDIFVLKWNDIVCVAVTFRYQGLRLLNTSSRCRVVAAATCTMQNYSMCRCYSNLLSKYNYGYSNLLSMQIMDTKLLVGFAHFLYFYTPLCLNLPHDSAGGGEFRAGFLLVKFCRWDFSVDCLLIRNRRPETHKKNRL